MGAPFNRFPPVLFFPIHAIITVMTTTHPSDYQKQLETVLSSLQERKERPRLLLHACCAPCSSYVLEYLADYFDITVFYYNPNIYPAEEYRRRLKELREFLPRFPPAQKAAVTLVEEAYEPESFYRATNVLTEKELQTERERGERCRRCYLLRMERAYRYAANGGYSFFTTTLSISPFKDAHKINAIGRGLEQADSGKTLFLPSDFKKKNGFLRSLQISREYGLYRQDYCGCLYSKQNTERERSEKEGK